MKKPSRNREIATVHLSCIECLRLAQFDLFILLPDCQIGKWKNEKTVGVDVFFEPSIMWNEFYPYVLVAAMKNLIAPFLSIFISTFFLSGCDLAQPKNKRQDDQPVVQNDQPPIEELPADPQVQKETEPNEDNTVTVQAAPGMTGKGTGYNTSTNNPMSIITVPVSTLFLTRERLVLQQVDHAMNLYKGEHGNAPSSHEEFMRKIIQENNIRLPRLPEGQQYVYDPSDGILKVRKPRDAQ